MLGYVTGVYDILRQTDMKKIDEAIQKNLEKNNEYFAIGVYNDELCKSLGYEALKSVQERIKIAKYLSGVDFTFEVSSKDPLEIKEAAQIALKKHLLELEKVHEKKEKEYDIVYAPGTYDLFHVGHLENLLEAAEKSKRVIVGVKSDELVREHKGRDPIMNAQERIEILRHFSFVDNVYEYFTRDPHPAAKWIKSKYKKSVDAIFLGSDLKEDFKNIKDIKIVFTDRDKKIMKSRSTSAYIKKLTARKGTINTIIKQKDSENEKSDGR